MLPRPFFLVAALAPFAPFAPFAEGGTTWGSFDSSRLAGADAVLTTSSDLGDFRGKITNAGGSLAARPRRSTRRLCRASTSSSRA